MKKEVKIIKESDLREMVRQTIVESIGSEWPMDAELDRNMNTFDDPSVRQAYVNGDDVSYIDGSTLRDRLNTNGFGTGVNYNDEELVNIVAEAIKKVFTGNM